MAKPMGFRLPGMVAVDKSVSTSFTVTESLKTALEFSTSHIVRVKIVKDSMDGSSVEVPDSRKAEAKLAEVRKQVSLNGGGVFVLFGYSGSDRKCLLVTYIPENMPVRQKMLFASSKGVVKKTIQERNQGIIIEPYNVSEIKEISEEIYNKKKTAEKPYSESEKLIMEYDQAEKAPGDSIMARLQEVEAQAPAYALPGFGIGMKPSEVKKNRIASMKVAQDKDAARIERVNFFVKLRKEKELMEREQMEAEESAQKKISHKIEEIDIERPKSVKSDTKSERNSEEEGNPERKSSEAQEVDPPVVAQDTEENDDVEEEEVQSKKSVAKKDSIDDAV